MEGVTLRGWTVWLVRLHALAQVCNAKGLSSSSGSESRLGSGNKFMSSSRFGQYSGVFGARNGVS